MRTLITGLGEVVSGDIAAPLLDADSILIEDGRIAAIGRGIDEDADVVIDGKGATAFPGLIDSHVHPVFGDWTPRQRTSDFIESELHGGVTSMISAGEVHLPGRPKDIVGLKALAIVAVRAFANVRPAGVKVHAGAPILELGLEEQDFADLAAAGVNLVGEVGLGLGQDGGRRGADARLGAAARHGLDVPHRRPVDRRVERHPRGRRARGAARTSSATSTAARPRSPTTTSSSSSRAAWRSRSSTAATAARRSTRSGSRARRAPSTG